MLFLQLGGSVRPPKKYFSPIVNFSIKIDKKVKNFFKKLLPSTDAKIVPSIETGLGVLIDDTKNDNDDIQVRSNIGGFKAGDRTKVKFDDAGVQNNKLEKINENKNNNSSRWNGGTCVAWM